MKFKIELSRQGNFIFAVLLIHFAFFGYICSYFEERIGVQLLYLYQVLFFRKTFLSFIILFAIVFFMTYREHFFEYGIRNSIWLTPIIIIESWIWYWFVKGFDLGIIGQFFTNYQGYLTIFSILGTNIFSAILASIIKQKYESTRKIK